MCRDFEIDISLLGGPERYPESLTFCRGAWESTIVSAGRLGPVAGAPLFDEDSTADGPRGMMLEVAPIERCTPTSLALLVDDYIQVYETHTC